MKTYDKYKPSGIDWIGDIPEHWEIYQLRHCIKDTLSNGLFKKSDEFGKGIKLINVSDLYRENFEIAFDKLDRVLANDKEKKIYKVIEGDIFFVRSSLKKEGIATSALARVIQEPTVFECHLVKASPEKEIIVPGFLIKYLNSSSAKHQLIASSQTTTMTTISQDKLALLKIIVPPLTEQTVIAKYLDKQTAQIDKLIENKKRLIELLKEERLGVINKAVTRGINPHAKLKPSGIDWLGDIPEHWEIKKLKYIAYMQGGFAFNSSDYIPEGVQLIKISNLYQNEFLLKRQPTFLPENFLDDYKNWIVKDGDILISMTGTLGKRDYGFAIQIENTDKTFLMNQRVSRIKFNDNQIDKNFGLLTDVTQQTVL